MPLRKAEIELVRYVAGETPLSGELAGWIEASPRFAAFVALHCDKIRKKLRAEGDAALSVRAELRIASLLLADRRFDVAPEAFGAGKVGPDLTVVFRSTYRFNVEITQLRPPSVEMADRGAKFRSVVATKLRQLPAGMANVLIIAAPGSSIAIADLATAMRRVEPAAVRAGDAFFVARGFAGARSFHGHLLRLSAVCAMDETTGVAAYWPNPLARHALPSAPARSLRRCMGVEPG